MVKKEEYKMYEKRNRNFFNENITKHDENKSLLFIIENYTVWV